MARKKDYKLLYDMQYYQSGLGIDYGRKEYWMMFFNNIAERIVESYKPKTVLDMGCAYGYLVEALRNISVGGG